MQDGGWVPRGPPGLIYSSESSQLWGPEQQACQPTGGFDWRSCTTPPPAAVTVIEVGEQR